MNVKIGGDNWYYEKVMGKYVIVVRNNNGEGLCNICCNNELVIIGLKIYMIKWIFLDGRSGK